MSFFKWLVAGAVGAAIGGVAWVLIGHFANYEVGWIAWGIGLLAGLGVRFAAGESEHGPAPGIAAVAAAAAVVAASKYAVVALAVNQFAAQIQATKPDFNSEPVAIARMADDVFETEYQAVGKEVAWPESEYDPENPKPSYPAELWAKAEQKWVGLSDAEKQGQKAVWQQQLDADMAGIDDIRSAAFAESFTFYDLLWFGLAMFTAFRVGSGLNNESAPKAEPAVATTPAAGAGPLGETGALRDRETGTLHASETHRV